MNGVPWTQEEVAKLEQLAASGATLREMCEALGVSHSRLTKKMRYLGASVRAARAAHRDLPAEALAAWQEHASIEAVRAALAVNWQTAKAALHAAGIDHRTQPKPDPRLPDDVMRALVS